MAVVATIEAALSLSSARFRRGLDRARMRQRSTFRRMQTEARRLRQAFLGITAAFAAFNAALRLGSILQTTDELIKASRAAGISFEAFQRLQAGLELFGISQSDLLRGTRTLSRAIVEARRGTLTYSEAFRLINTNFDQLNRLSPENRFYAVLEALEATEDASIRQRVAQDLLGRSFANTTVRVALLRREADRLTPVTERNGEIVEAFNDSITRTSRVIRNVLINAIAPYLERLTELIERFGEFVRANPQLVRTITIVGGLTTALIGLAGAVTVLRVGLALLYTQFPLLAVLSAAIVALGPSIVSFFRSTDFELWVARIQDFSASVIRVFRSLSNFLRRYTLTYEIQLILIFLLVP